MTTWSLIERDLENVVDSARRGRLDRSCCCCCCLLCCLLCYVVVVVVVSIIGFSFKNESTKNIKYYVLDPRGKFHFVFIRVRVYFIPVGKIQNV